MIEAIATILSGIVSLFIIFGALIDWVTGGWLRHHVRQWLGLDRLYRQSRIMQIFTRDMSESHNELVDALAEEDAIDPDTVSKISAEQYDRLMENGDIERGYFLEEDE